MERQLIDIKLRIKRMNEINELFFDSLQLHKDEECGKYFFIAREIDKFLFVLKEYLNIDLN